MNKRRLHNFWEKTLRASLGNIIGTVLTLGTRKRLQDFFVQSSSATFGTVVGIVLTFGTTLFLQDREQKKIEKQSALMVIDNLDHFTCRISEYLEDIDDEDSLNLYVWKNLDNLNKIPNDTLELFLDNFNNINISIYDNTAENIFTTNIDTWKNLGCSEFVEKAGKCFALKKMAIDYINELREMKQQVGDTIMAITVCCDRTTEDPQDIVKRLFASPVTRLFIIKQHTQYRMLIKIAASVLKDQNTKNKELMQVTDKMLENFGDNNNSVYYEHSEPTL